MTNLPYDEYKQSRDYEGRRASRRRYTGWMIFIAGVFSGIVLTIPWTL